MNKTELIAAAAAAANVSKKDAAAVIDAALAAVSASLAKEEKVQLIGFGTFETRKRPAREGKNPRTGEVIKIAACKVPAFKAGAALKNAVNK
jgi:DNA-binding protein HU-beta